MSGSSQEGIQLRGEEQIQGLDCWHLLPSRTRCSMDPKEDFPFALPGAQGEEQLARRLCQGCLASVSLSFPFFEMGTGTGFGLLYDGEPETWEDVGGCECPFVSST